MGIRKVKANKGFISRKPTKSLSEINVNAIEKRYTKKYIGKAIVDFSLELKVRILLKRNPKKIPDKKAITADVR